MTAARPIDRFWEGFFGRRPEPGVHVVPHAALAGYAGVWLFAREASCIVSAPPDWCGVLERAFGNSTVASVLSPDGFRAVFGDAFDRSVGPTWLGWLPPDEFRPAHDEAVRPASPAELQALREASPPEAWEDADLHEEGAFGYFEPGEFEEGEIQAAASMTSWGDAVVGPGVLSRRPGCGKAVVSAVCADALENGKLVIYQTLRENERAVGIARRLGFSFYASHIAVRLLQA